MRAPPRSAVSRRGNENPSAGARELMATCQPFCTKPRISPLCGAASMSALPGAGRPNNHQRSSSSGSSKPSRVSSSARAAGPSSFSAAAVDHLDFLAGEPDAQAADAQRAVERKIRARGLLSVTQARREPLPVRRDGDAAAERVTVDLLEGGALLRPGRIRARTGHDLRRPRAATRQQREHGQRRERPPHD